MAKRQHGRAGGTPFGGRGGKPAPQMRKPQPGAVPARTGAETPQQIALVNRGVKAQMAGDAAAAEECYLQVLAEDAGSPLASLYLGTLRLQQRQYHEAAELFARAKAGGRDDEVYYINAGLCCFHLGELERAVELLKVAVSKAPQTVEAYYNLGSALYSLQRYDEAAAAFQQADALNPGDIRTAFHLGCALQDARNYDEALVYLRKVLEREPENARANCACALCLLRLYRADEALPYAQKAMADAPDNPVVCYNCAHVFRTLGQLQEAQAAFEAALNNDPDCLEALIGLGRLLTDTGKCEESRAYFDRAIAVCPTYYNAYAARGMSCFRSDLAEAVEWFDKALAINPVADDVLMYKGYVLGLLGRSTEAEACLREAIRLNPKFAEHYQNLANVLLAQGRVGECLDVNRESFTLNPRNHLVFSNVLLYSHYLTQSNREDLWRLHQNYDKMYRAQMRVGAPPAFANPRDPERRLRIGIVSADFRRHSCAYFLHTLLHGYDRQKLEVIAYASVKSPDNFTEGLSKLSDGWRDIMKISNLQAANLIYRDHVDILIDLGGHTADNRLPIFFYKPAPLQVAWLGYPDTTGVTTMDYRITDAIADPPGSEKYSSESLIRLPGGFHCYAYGGTTPPVGPLPADANGFITFGSFNNFAKVSDETAYLWSEVLKNTPESKLFLKSLGLDDPAVRERIWQRFEKLGLPRDRIELAGRVSKTADHLELYNRVDIALDTYPYNGTTTTFEALLMGLPVITLGGATHASLVGRSILSHMGMAELACGRPEEFIHKTVSLAKNTGLLRQLRTTMRERLCKSPLMDEAGFCRKFEEAMRLIWRRFCQQSPAAGGATGGDAATTPAPVPAPTPLATAPVQPNAEPGKSAGAVASAVVSAPQNTSTGIPAMSADLKLNFSAASPGGPETPASAATRASSVNPPTSPATTGGVLPEPVKSDRKLSFQGGMAAPEAECERRSGTGGGLTLHF